MTEFLKSEEVVLRSVILRNAREAPHDVCVWFEDGSAWTHLDVLREASAAANALRAAGAERGSVVAAALPNGPGYLRAWWGAAMLGAVLTPVNPSYRGPILEHLLAKANPRVVVAAGDIAGRIGGAGLASEARVLDPEELRGADCGVPALESPIEAWDVHSLAMTSGTTGPPKLVQLSYAHTARSGAGSLARWKFSSDDTYLCDLPLFHIAAVNTTCHMLRTRARIALRTRPALEDYWEVARSTGATYAQIYSTMTSYLITQPHRPAEKSHRLRLVSMIPLPSNSDGFRDRFAIPDVVTSWGSTEAGGAITGGSFEPMPAGTCGRLREGWEVRLVDEHDLEVGEGEAGEAILRCDEPWMITTAYVGDPEATAAAWRNGWFHTGDLLRRDGAGWYYFVDRSKDSLRRRGQNVSSFEVEAVVSKFPGIMEVAVVPERSDVAIEDEVKAWLVLSNGNSPIDFVDLLRHCAALLPHYMVPRYFEIADEFPKTPTTKIRKDALRALSSGPATWDRVAHGYDVTRRGVEILSQ